MKKQEKPFMIRTFKKEDTEAVMRIWLNGNLEAHGFVPADYWRENLPMVCLLYTSDAADE